MERLKRLTDKRSGRMVLTIAVLAIIVIIVAFGFNRFDAVRGFIDKIIGILGPIIYGFIFAFLMAPVYNRLCLKTNKVIASAVCLLILILAVTLLGIMVIPQLIDSLMSLVKNSPKAQQWIVDSAKNIFSSNPAIRDVIVEYVEGFNLALSKWISDEFIPNIRSYALSVSSGLASVLTTFKNVIIGLIVMVYLLNIKKTLIAQMKKILFSIFSIPKANVIIREFQYIKDVFSKFIVGKIIDSILIGMLTFIVISIFRIPYTLLIAVVVGVTNIIPFFGPFIGAIPCAFLLLAVSPVKCLEFVIIILVIQQFDGNILGPKILGERTGVPSFWVLFSILLFGGLFGIFGMIIAVPTFAVIYRFVRNRVNAALAEKELPVDTGEYVALDGIEEGTKRFIKANERES